VIERKEKFFFDAVWGQAHVEHQVFVLSQEREPYRIGVLDLPPPKELGEAYFVGLVANKKDPRWGATSRSRRTTC